MGPIDDSRYAWILPTEFAVFVGAHRMREDAFCTDCFCRTRPAISLSVYSVESHTRAFPQRAQIIIQGSERLPRQTGSDAAPFAYDNPLQPYCGTGLSTPSARIQYHSMREGIRVTLAWVSRGGSSRDLFPKRGYVLVVIEMVDWPDL